MKERLNVCVGVCVKVYLFVFMCMKKRGRKKREREWERERLCLCVCAEKVKCCRCLPVKRAHIFQELNDSQITGHENVVCPL